uniref:RNA polymerase I and III subunit D n=1 Tax=Macaca mulatta TaxID=9544 RepID=A0A1D5QJ37_MACMU
MEEDQELERKAIEELLKEAKRGKTRAETMGPMGWMKCPLASTNKRFLINTIKNTLPSHKEQDHEQKEGDKEPAKSQAQKEENPKKHRSHPYKHSFRARGSASYSPPRKRSSQDKKMSPSTLLPSQQKEEDGDSVSLFTLPSFPKCLSGRLAVPRPSPCHIPAPHFLAAKKALSTC